MGILDRLRSRREVEVETPTSAAHPVAPVTDLFVAVYGHPDPDAPVRKDGVTFLHGDAAERHLARLTPEQAAGYSAEAELARRRGF